LKQYQTCRQQGIFEAVSNLPAARSIDGFYGIIFIANHLEYMEPARTNFPAPFESSC